MDSTRVGCGRHGIGGSRGAIAGGLKWEETMPFKIGRTFAALLASTIAGQAYAQDAVTVVLSEELENVEPCMAAKSNIGRVILQNVSDDEKLKEPNL